MNKKIIALAAMLFAINFSSSQTIETSTFGKGLLNLKAKDSSWTMKLGARFQVLSSSSWDYSDQKLSDQTTSTLIRRSRLKFDGYAFSPKLVYKLEIGLSNRDISGGSKYTGNTPRYVMDAVLKWKFYENFVLWFGQTKLPGNRERVISSANLQFVDRSILNSRFNIDRDIGLQLHHKTAIGNSLVMKEIVSISQGEGRNVTTGNQGGYQYTGRLEVFPFGEFDKKEDYMGSDLLRTQTPKLSLAVTYDYNQDAVRTRSNMGSYMENDLGLYQTNISTIFADFMFKYKGLSIMGEYAKRNADDPIAKNSDGTETGDIVLIGKGYNIQSGYLLKNNWEFSGRYSNNEFEEITDADRMNSYTLGISKYFVGHKLKLQTDFSYLNSESNDSVLARLQVEIHF
ncbi:porin [Mangrovimonas sp. CR14]|uniref:porin n=1 Tax=Mangrovimonas sp. CR14 TaxID=2706120 RepID=UPI0014203328|nr:porin [Mangrovimonas sp. CR14]NIK90636.1 porin [Mangrovimonas sp. CR14]